MAQDVKICVTITCDRCLCPAVVGYPTTAGHWPSVEAAAQSLLQLGWEAGQFEQICPECVIARQCQQQGHDWEPWQHLISLTGGQDEARRECLRCGHPQVASAAVGGER